ncbi:DUF3137 domain-containing protein [Pedobacter jejuensis]|uniref:DUF3137 domain-containing protein n=1 Tax=Pedobacter jejuensis TaxID=1268550 RepID=A0A3N0BQC1_9SPHI|nr:DUF3137 domain-containing protein [Pedobacter jejuensis]RNL50668.1 DUF3137 domain-containing protein [Pedobacter jejuensis]
MVAVESNATLQNLLASLEIQRKKISSTQKKGYLLIALGVVVGVGGSILGQPVIAIIAGLIPFIYGIVIHYKIADELKAYKESFKIEVIGTALKSLDQSLTIEPYNGIQCDEFENTQLFSNTPDRYSTEDLVKGNAGKTGFYFAEIHAEYKTKVQTKNGTRTEWHTIFKGILFAADFNKNFNGVTLAKPRDIFGSMGAWFSKNLFSFSNKDVVTLENLEFNNAFITHATDQVEARYILTPSLMERILRLNQNAQNTISLSFINSRMYIAFPLDRNYFEAPIFKTLLNPELLNQDIVAINFMYDIVKELDLNTRIWGKN